MFVGSEVIQDQMDFQALINRFVDPVEKSQELLMPVLRLTFSDYRTFEHIQRREQSRRSMALIIVRSPRGQARTQRKDQLCSVQRLNLALLVHAQNNRFIRRIHVEAHTVAYLPRKLRIVAELEGFDAMRLQFVFLPDSLHCRRTDLLRRSHGTHAPLRRVFRSRLHRGFHDGGFPLCRDPFGTAASWAVFKNPGDAVRFKALPP
jgi:hypothetical protein